MSDEIVVKDPYMILGLDPKDKPDEIVIKSAYRKKVMKHHPDHQDDKNAESDEFKDVIWAYRILSDKEKRERYDKFGFLEPDMSELKQGVQSTIRAYLTQMMQKGDDIFGIDLVAQISTFCKAQKSVARGEIAACQKKESYTKKVMSKFRKKKNLSYDFVTNIFIEELNGLYESMRLNMKTIRILEETINVVNSYEFEIDPSVVVNKIVPDPPSNQKTNGVNLGNIFDHAS